MFPLQIKCLVLNLKKKLIYKSTSRKLPLFIGKRAQILGLSINKTSCFCVFFYMFCPLIYFFTTQPRENETQLFFPLEILTKTWKISRKNWYKKPSVFSRFLQISSSPLTTNYFCVSLTKTTQKHRWRHLNTIF